MIETKNEKMKYLFNIYLLLIICLSGFFVYGCNSGVKPYVRPNVDYTGIKTMAVLPLNNLTADKYAAEKIRGIVIMDLLSRGIDVTEPGEVIKVLGALKVKSVKSIVIEDIKRIGRMLNVDAIIVGSVETFTISKGITVSYPEVSVNLRMHESATGNVIWSVWHTTGGASFWTRHFGAEGRTLDEASKTVIEEAFDTFEFKG